MYWRRRCADDSSVRLVFCGALLGLFTFVNGKVGDSCVEADTNKPGVCVMLRDCTSALTKLQEEQNYPQICNFQGTVPIVCCPQEVTNRPQEVGNTPQRVGNRVVGEISKQKCEEYAKIAYSTGPQPTLILGGTDATEAEFPHMALIGYKNLGEKLWSCGGSLISENYVLTAAHCLYSRSYGMAIFVRLGVTNIHDDDYRQEFNIVERIHHPDYNHPSFYSDIALVKLDKPARFGAAVKPACLYTEEQVSTRIAIASGWGRTEFAGERSENLLKVVLEIIDINTCNASYARSIGRKLKRGIDPDIQICAGSTTENKDTSCQGDSGGPLQITNLGCTAETNASNCTYSVVGVNSFGKPCGIVNSPGIYTKVYAHLKWIEDTVWPQ